MKPITDKDKATHTRADSVDSNPIAEGSAFSADDVLNAYHAGKVVGVTGMVDAFERILKRNIQDAAKLTNQLDSFMKSIDFSYLDVYIRPEPLYGINLIVAVTENHFVNEKFMEVYRKVAELESHFNNDSLQIDTIFLPIGDHFSEEELLSDGYLKTTRKL